MSVKRLFNARQQYLNSNADPYSGALLFVYLAGSSTRATTYNSSAGSVANTNPLVLDSAGRLQAEVWVTTGASYKLVLAASGDGDSITNPSSPIWTEDNITGINDATVAAQDQWVSGPTPTYVGATSFTLAGDQTATFHVGRRVKTTNTAGTVYSTITASAFGALTTLTVVNDSGTLDSGLSAVSYGLLSATNPSVPSILSLTSATTGALTVTGATSTSSLTVNSVPVRGITLATPQASTSGTSIDFTGIPSGVKRITMGFVGFSTSGVDPIWIQIGDAGGIETSGYFSGVAGGVAYGLTRSTASFVISVVQVAAGTYQGSLIFSLENSSNNTWVMQGTFARLDALATMAVFFCTGSKATSAVLDRVRITTLSGTDTFDAGEINISYE